MLALEPTELLEGWLYKTREPSGNLYPSMDLLGSLRHSMLRVAGAPVREQEDLLSLVRLETGTMWHDHFDMLWRRSQLPVMLETRLTQYMPEGWSGRADWIHWSDEYRAFVLSDLKTIKPEGMGYIRKDGAKAAHLWQLSAYWYALEKMGLPLVKAFHVYYLPMSPLTGGEVKPELIEAQPLDRDLVLGTMVDRAAKVKLYLEKIVQVRDAYRIRSHSQSPAIPELTPEELYVNEFLEPVQERQQALRWDKAKGIFNLMLLPDWSTNYCAFPPELCDCHTQGQTKVGHFEYAEAGPLYVARKDYGHIIPEVKLTSAQRKKLEEARAADTESSS